MKRTSSMTALERVSIARQVAQLVLRIEQRQRHEIEAVGVAQPGDDAIEQFAQRMRAQQLDLARLGLAQQQLVALDLVGERAQPVAQFFRGTRVGIARGAVHARRSVTERRSSRYSRPRRMSAAKASKSCESTAERSRSTACASASSDSAP